MTGSRIPKTYIIVLLVTVSVIAGGFFVFGGSIEKGIKKSYRDSNAEDGYFELKHEATDELLKAFGKEDIILYAKDKNNYAWSYKEEPENEEKEKETAEALKRKLTILADTGGMTDDALEADIAESNRKQWQEYLDKMQAKAEELKQKREELNAGQEEANKKAEPYVIENGELQMEAVKIQSTREVLMKEIFAYLISTGAIRDYTEIENNENELSPEIQALLPSDLKARAAVLQARADALQEKYDELDRKYSYLDDETEDLQNRTEALYEEEQKLEESQAEINDVKEKLKELETYEDDKNEIVSFIPVYEDKEFTKISRKMKRIRTVCAVILVLSIMGTVLRLKIKDFQPQNRPRD